MHWIDWSIVVLILGLMISGVVISKRYMRSIADFLSAGRTAGRYMVSVASGIAGLGAITVIANFEMNFNAGFAMTWWGFTMGIFVLIITVSGWVIYRFRETRALTMAQFFELRYSRNFRIFTGSLAFVAGVINFGIFPSVGARFFIYFCGLPQTFPLFGIDVSTYAVTMMVLLSLSIYFVFSGGQIAVIITDFLQGLVVNIVFLVIIIMLFKIFTFDQIFDALQTAPENASLINPFKTSQAKDFNLGFFIIGVIGAFYSTLSWQGTQGYNSSAKTAHEAKMGAVLTNWRGIPQVLFLLIIPIIAYTVLHHQDFLAQAGLVQGTLDGLDSSAVKSQLTVPLVLTHFLPRGLMGALAAVMLAAFISTHDTYLHSWASILVQDVLLPIRKKPFTKEQHLKVLRWAIIGVAVFIFIFSLYLRQTQFIMLFWAVTGAIFAGGSGAVIIGGLYWKRGTTTAAWSAMITGAVISVFGFVVNQMKEDFFINGQWFWGIAMVAAMLVYVLVSLFSKKKVFNLDKLLNRGEYAIQGEHKVVAQKPARGLKLLGMGKEFSLGDKIIYIITYCWILFWALIFIVGTFYYFAYGISDRMWMELWKIYLKINISIAVIVVVWFAIGGFRDLRRMLYDLKNMKRNDADDGFVRNAE